jgi:hypothetical protein
MLSLDNRNRIDNVHLFHMEYKITLPDDDPKHGFQFIWEPDAEIEVTVDNNVVQITANKDGLISLARHLINLSQDHFGKHYHFHLDDYNALEKGSNELIIQKA